MAAETGGEVWLDAGAGAGATWTCCSKAGRAGDGIEFGTVPERCGSTLGGLEMLDD